MGQSPGKVDVGLAFLKKYNGSITPAVNFHKYFKNTKILFSLIPHALGEK
jgi:hypothetical protein